METMTKKEVRLWEQMAELTKRKCLATCHQMGSCCDAMYCRMAEETAKAHGVTVEPTGNPKVPFAGEKGCVMPPQFRQMCTLHQCKISGLGFDPKDPKWTKEYFDLREKLERIGFDETSGM